MLHSPSNHLGSSNGSTTLRNSAYWISCELGCFGSKYLWNVLIYWNNNVGLQCPGFLTQRQSSCSNCAVTRPSTFVGIRSVAECMAKSRSEKTQEAARDVLELLAEGNPRFRDQVYKGLIAVLPCDSAKAQQLALQSIRILQVSMRCFRL